VGGLLKPGGEVGGGWLGSQCCLVAKTPAKKLKRGWRKKKWYGRHFLKEFPSFTVMKTLRDNDKI
jgi:hypothetical protein